MTKRFDARLELSDRMKNEKFALFDQYFAVSDTNSKTSAIYYNGDSQRLVYPSCLSVKL